MMATSKQSEYSASCDWISILHFPNTFYPLALLIIKIIDVFEVQHYNDQHTVLPQTNVSDADSYSNLITNPKVTNPIQHTSNTLTPLFRSSSLPAMLRQAVTHKPIIS